MKLYGLLSWFILVFFVDDDCVKILCVLMLFNYVVVFNLRCSFRIVFGVWGNDKIN